VQPVVPLSTHTDYFGTVVTPSTSKSAPEIGGRGEVERRESRGLIAPAISWSDLRAPALVDFFSEYLFATDRTKLTGDVLAPLDEWKRIATCTVAWTRECLRARSRDVLAGRHVGRGDRPRGLGLGEGVCQDLTHVTIGLLRELGYRALRVGYLFL